MSKAAQKISFIGAGNLASSIIRGLLAQGYPPAAISASAPSKRTLERLTASHKINASTDNRQCARTADIVILAVKPLVIKTVCLEIAEGLADDCLVISLAAGLKCSSISHWLGDRRPLVRCMPNTPAQVLSAASALYANRWVSDSHKRSAEDIMSTVGLCCWLGDENQIDTVTALSGSGPAYFFLFIEAMIDAAVAMGLDRETASALAIQTGLGASRLARESADDLRELRRKVTSPGGTTEQAITRFEADGLRHIVRSAMEAAAMRAKELSKENEEPHST